MKVKIYLFLFPSIILHLSLSYSYPKAKKDTIYYIIDTLHTPINDRMISAETAIPYKFFTINCPCLNNNIKPAFRCNVTLQTDIDRNDIKNLKLISLPQLIQFVKKNDTKDFNINHILFFLEAVEQKFIKRRAFFLGSEVIITN